MLTQESVLHNWLDNLNNNSALELTPLTGDASFRRYFRLHDNTSSHIVMDTSRQKESLPDFIQIAGTLNAAGVRTPEIYAVNLEQGFALLEDFGDTLLLDEIKSDQTHQYYGRALDTLQNIQQCSIQAPDLKTFDKPMIQKELALFQTWFLERWLQMTLSPTEDKLISQALSYMTDELVKQPQCFMHRDYHSRNLALLIKPNQDTSIGVFDFQDAVRGPFTYDLVSLLKDVYVEWPENTRLQWLNDFYDALPNKAGYSRDAFEQGFHLCGLQRHLKILGIFCRLNQRDGKPQYLRDLPLTFKYILDTLQAETSLAAFYDFMQTRVYPIFDEKIHA